MGGNKLYRPSGTRQKKAQDGEFNPFVAAAASRRPEPEKLFS